MLGPCLWSIDFDYNFNETTLVVGERLKLELTIPHDKASDIIADEPPTPDGLRLYYGPDMRPRTRTDEKGELEKYVLIVYEYRTTKKGVINLGTFHFHLREGGEEFSTTPEEFILLDRDERNLSYPIDAQWVLPDGRYYENQSIPVTLEVTGAGQMAFPTKIDVSSPTGAVFQDISAYSGIQTIRHKRGQAYNIPAATYMLNPTRSGQILLDRARVDILGVRRTTDRVVLNILPLPSQVANTRAIGRFEQEYELATPEISEGGEILLTIAIKGTGNLYGLLPPTIDTDLTSLGVEDSIQVNPSSEGYKGIRTFHYRFLGDSTGQHHLQIPAYSVLNPQTGRVYNLASHNLVVDVTHADIEESKEVPDYSLIAKEELSNFQESKLYANPFQHLWILPGIFCFVLLAFTKKRGKSVMTLAIIFLISAGIPKDFPDSSDAYNAWMDGDYEMASVLFSTYADQTQNAAFYYNAGVSYLKENKVGEGLYALRKAIRIKPMNLIFRDTLKDWEDYFNYPKSVNPAFMIHGNVFYFVLILSINLVLIFAGLFVRYKKGSQFFVAILFAMTLVVSGTGLIYTLWYNSLSQGIVMEADSPIVKVPSDKASEWMTLVEGTSFQIKGLSNNYYLIRTSYGLEGWILKDRIRILS